MNDLFIDFLLQLFFGWPAIMTSILLSVAGVGWRKPALLVLAGLVGLPFTVYMTWGYHTPALVLSLFQFGSAFASARRKSLFAWLLIMPMIVSTGFLAYLVVTQPLGR